MNALTIPRYDMQQGLSGYLRQVNAAPMLTLEEEQSYARSFRDNNDLEAASKMVLSHLRYVAKVARGFVGYGLPLGDLIQEGNVGLMKAVKKFDPEQNVRLVSFAMHWIKAEIYEYVLKNWRIVKVATTKAQRKLFFNLRKAKKSTDWLKQGEVHALANNLDVEESVVVEMEQRMTGHDVAFNYLSDADDDNNYSPEDYMADNRYNPERIASSEDQATNENEKVYSALESLDSRSQDIIRRRWLSEDESKSTLHELADEYNVSAERIRQIEKQAMNKMKNAMVVIP